MSKERSTFHGDDEDYKYPYYHRYNEPDSDRGASDENHGEENAYTVSPQANQ